MRYFLPTEKLTTYKTLILTKVQRGHISYSRFSSHQHEHSSILLNERCRTDNLPDFNNHYSYFLFAVALGMPPLVPDPAPNPVVTGKELLLPLVGDVIPVQGHVVVEDPAPQVRLDSTGQQEETDQSPQQDQVKKDNLIKQELVANSEVQKELPEKEGMVELEVKVKQGDKEDQELKAKEEVKMERHVNPEAKPDVEVHLNPEDMAELEVKVKSEAKMESEHNVSPDFKVESEVKVDPDVQWEPEVKPQEVQEKFSMEMDNEEKTETDQEVEERHVDMEGKINDEPEDESELLDDDSMLKEELSDAELSELEKSLRAEFQNPDPEAKPLPEEEGPIEFSNDVLDGGPIMEFEPDMEDPSLYQQPMPGSPIMDEGPALDIMGQPILNSRSYFANEEAIMGMDTAKQRDSDHLMMERAGSEFVREEDSTKYVMPIIGEPAMEDHPGLDRADQIGVMAETEREGLMQQEVDNPADRRGLPKGNL